jgi:thiol-disulfide isomerase/thioredoxin
MLLFTIIGAVIGGVGGFLIAFGRSRTRAAGAGTPGAETAAPAETGRRIGRSLGSLLGTALIGVAVGGFVGYMVYDFKNIAYKRSKEIVEIENERQFDDLIANSGKPVLVDFYSPSCAPCAEMAPVISEIADETKGRALVLSVNTDVQTGLARRYNVGVIPIFVIIRNRHETARYTGITDKQALLKALAGK